MNQKTVLKSKSAQNTKSFYVAAFIYREAHCQTTSL